MKFLYYTLTFLFAAFLTGCSDSDSSEENPQSGFITPVLETQLQALTSSRATIDESTGQTRWTASDELLVFVHETGKQPTSISEWNNCRYKFVTNTANSATNKFQQDAKDNNKLLLDPKKKYDWYVMYPYNESVLSPVGHGSYNIGNQTQDCKHPMLHLGKMDILANAKENVNAEQQVSISLNHLGTFMSFRIQNATGSDFIPRSVDFETEGTTPAPISGACKVDFKNGLTPITSDGNQKMNISLDNAIAIQSNSTFDIYAIMAPFTLNANDKFKVNVVTDKGNSLQTSIMRSTITFKAGTMNKAKVKASFTSQESDVNPWEVQGEIEDHIIM